MEIDAYGKPCEIVWRHLLLKSYACSVICVVKIWHGSNGKEF